MTNPVYNHGERKSTNAKSNFVLKIIITIYFIHKVAFFLEFIEPFFFKTYKYTVIIIFTRERLLPGKSYQQLESGNCAPAKKCLIGFVKITVNIIAV